MERQANNNSDYVGRKIDRKWKGLSILEKEMPGPDCNTRKTGSDDGKFL